MARLIVLGPDGPKRFELVAKLVIGRDPGCDVKIDDGASSRRHCEIERRGPGFYIRDLGSSNGTRVNSQKIKGEIELRPEDEIKIGTTIMYFEDES